MKILVKSYVTKPPFSEWGKVSERTTFRKRWTVAQLLEEMGLTEGEVGLLFVNKQRVGRDYSLKEGDFVEIVPLIDGG
jgi:sulfur carrier protein ThiS